MIDGGLYLALTSAVSVPGLTAVGVTAKLRLLLAEFQRNFYMSQVPSCHRHLTFFYGLESTLSIRVVFESNLCSA